MIKVDNFKKKKKMIKVDKFVEEVVLETEFCKNIFVYLNGAYSLIKVCDLVESERKEKRIVGLFE